MLLPIRNSPPSSSIAARARSSSKKVPFVESKSFKLIWDSFTSSKQCCREISGSFKLISAPCRPTITLAFSILRTKPLSGPSITLTLASTPGGRAKVASGIPNSLALPSRPVRANEGKGDITIVASALNFTSTTVGLPHFEQLNCTFACRVTSSSFKTCSAPQFVHFAFMAALSIQPLRAASLIQSTSALRSVTPVLRLNIQKTAGVLE